TRNQRLSALSAFSEYAQNRDFDAASVFRSAIIRIPVNEYYGAAEPPVRCDESHLSGLTEPPHLFCY
ncbi:tyrosine-type recombinase/integrase, partial [Bariatricus sp. HCP28S3_E4]